jgi:hypothetical protein
MKRKVIRKARAKRRKRGAPKTLHCSRCKFVTHSGIKGLAAHYRKKHPKIMSRR